MKSRWGARKDGEADLKVGQRPASEGGPYRREENGKESEKNRKGTEKERKKIGEDGARLRR